MEAHQAGLLRLKACHGQLLYARSFVRLFERREMHPIVPKALMFPAPWCRVTNARSLRSLGVDDLGYALTAQLNSNSCTL